MGNMCNLMHSYDEKYSHKKEIAWGKIADSVALKLNSIFNQINIQSMITENEKVVPQWCSTGQH